MQLSTVQCITLLPFHYHAPTFHVMVFSSDLSNFTFHHRKFKFQNGQTTNIRLELQLIPLAEPDLGLV